MRIVLIIIGILLAAAGGVIAYRAAFLEPHTAIVVTETNVRELPNAARIAGGLALLIIGAAIASFSARPRR